MAATFKMKFITVTCILLMTSFISSINSERIDCRKVKCPLPEVMESCPSDSILIMIPEPTTTTTTMAPTTSTTTTTTTSTTTTTTTTPPPLPSTVIESEEDDLESELDMITKHINSELSNPAIKKISTASANQSDAENDNELSENSNSTNTSPTTTATTPTTKKRRNRKKNKSTTEEPPVKQLSKRSLGYRRRESIKIVPGDYRNYEEYFRRYYNQKWKRSIGFSESAGIISELRSKQSSSVNAADSDDISLVKECCPKQISTCVCRNDCEKPICVNAKQILVVVKQGNASHPGQCCPKYECVYTQPDCSLYSQSQKIYWPSKCVSCTCINGAPLCSNTCPSIQHQNNIESNCYSENAIEIKVFKEGEKWKEGDCTDCECENGNRHCFTTQCASMYNCTVQKKIRGECCPICDDENLKTTTVLPTTSEIPITTLNKNDEIPTTENIITSTTACAIIPTTSETQASISKILEDNVIYIIPVTVVLALMVITLLCVWCIKASRKSKKNSYLAISNGDSNSSHNNMENGGVPANNANNHNTNNHRNNKNHLNHQHSNSSSN